MRTISLDETIIYFHLVIWWIISASKQCIWKTKIICLLSKTALFHKINTARFNLCRHLQNKICSLSYFASWNYLKRVSYREFSICQIISNSSKKVDIGFWKEICSKFVWTLINHSSTHRVFNSKFCSSRVNIINRICYSIDSKSKIFTSG